MSDISHMTGADYRTRLPAMLADSLTGPNGEPCFTPTDRRWLWRLEGFLAVCATTETQRQMHNDLKAFLVETCEHHWDDYFGLDLMKCVWCDVVQEVAS